VRCCALEEASLDGSRLLAYLPGCILVNREPLGSGLLPDTSPNRITRSVLAAVYALLQVRGMQLTPAGNGAAGSLAPAWAVVLHLASLVAAAGPTGIWLRAKAVLCLPIF
jgi:hypothetical protein